MVFACPLGQIGYAGSCVYGLCDRGVVGVVGVRGVLVGARLLCCQGVTS